MVEVHRIRDLACHPLGAVVCLGWVQAWLQVQVLNWFWLVALQRVLLRMVDCCLPSVRCLIPQPEPRLYQKRGGHLVRVLQKVLAH